MTTTNHERLRGRIRYVANVLRDLYEDLDAIPEGENGKYTARRDVSDAIDALDSAYLACPREQAP